MSNLLKHANYLEYSTEISEDAMSVGNKLPSSDAHHAKSVQSALSDLKRPPERLQSQCNYRLFIT